MWVTGIANNRGGVLVVACVCVCVCVSGYLSMAHKQVQVKERGGKQISDFVVEETETS